MKKDHDLKILRSVSGCKKTMLWGEKIRSYFYKNIFWIYQFALSPAVEWKGDRSAQCARYLSKIDPSRKYIKYGSNTNNAD